MSSSSPDEPRRRHPSSASSGEEVGDRIIVEQEVWPKAPDIPVGVGRDHAQALERAADDEMNGGEVVMGAGGGEATPGGSVCDVEPDAPFEQL